MDEHKHCSTCGETKPHSEFHRQADKKSGLRSQCKKCTNSRNLAKYHSCNRTRKSHHKAARKHSLMKLYGITIEDYESMLDSQDGVCKVCSKPEGKKDFLSVDHCHTTGKVRGLLCTSCNQGLGHFKDNINLMQRAIEYLKEVE